MIQVVRVRSGLCCDGDHLATQTPPYAVLALEGDEDAYIALCGACAQHLVGEVLGFLQTIIKD